MRIFIYKTLLAIIFLCVIVCCSVVCYRLFPLPNYSYNWFDKENALKQRPDNSIIITGGSGTAFGFNSEIISDQTKRNVLNIGLHAGLGSRFILNHAKDNCRQGDVWLLVLEYEMFFVKPFGNSGDTLSSIFLQSPREVGKYIDYCQYPVILQYVPTVLKGYFINNVVQRCYKLDTVYAYGVCNQYGDVIKHWEKKNIALAKPSHSYEKIDDEAVEYYAETVKKMREKGATVLLLPPTIPKSLYALYRDRFSLVEQSLKNKGVDYSVPIERYVFEDEMFYDTVYHLNKNGADLRSKMVTEDISSCCSF